jgi:uncharacterized lipoprotein
MLLVRVALLALVGIYVQGCAVIPDTVSFQYHSQTVPAPIPGAAQVVVQVGVTDVRPGDPRKISNKKNGYGMEMATIRTDRPVDHIVGDALAEELIKDGFQIGPGPVIVAAEVERFANDYKMGFFSSDAVAEVTIAIQVRTLDGRILYARTFSADGTETGVFLMEGHNARLSLEQTLPVIMSRLMTDPAFLRALLDGGSAPRRTVTGKAGPAAFGTTDSMVGECLPITAHGSMSWV